MEKAQRYWARQIPNDVAQRAQVVFATDYDKAWDRIRELETLVASLSSAWQPIETAPTEGWFLVTDGAYTAQVFPKRGDTFLTTTNSYPFDGATHWMPLPAPPGAMATAHDNLRLRTLLTWAVEFVERETQYLEDCHRLTDGDIDDEDVKVEIADARKWLKETQEVLGQ